MKENSIEEALEKLSTSKKIKMYELLRTFKREGIENFVITRKKYVDVILSDYKRVLKENEELKIIKSAIQTLQINSLEEEKYIVISKSSFLDGSYKHLLDEYISKSKVEEIIQKYYDEYEKEKEYRYTLDVEDEQRILRKIEKELLQKEGENNV